MYFAIFSLQALVQSSKGRGGVSKLFWTRLRRVSNILTCGVLFEVNFKLGFVFERFDTDRTHGI